MAELTKQYFDKQLGKLATKEDLKSLVTKKDLKSEITGLETKIENVKVILETKIENEVANLAGMMSRRFDELEKKLDVRAEVDELKIKMNKVYGALNIKN